MGNIRHIIVEGCDGTGKTNLVNRILARYPHLVMHERASSSTGGPVPALDEWTTTDATTMGSQAHSVYDRHPIISEPIYGPICRSGVPGSFNYSDWTHAIRQTVAEFTIVVFCIPPWQNVWTNIYNTRDNQMPGVTLHARRIYDTYDRVARAWPGSLVRHDYTTDPESQNVLAYLSLIFGGRINVG